MPATDTFFQVTAGAGTKLHTFTRSVSGQTVHDDVGILGLQPYPTYSLAAPGLTTATAASHLLQLMAGSSLNVYLVGIWVSQRALATTSTVQQFELHRLTTAGTGGTAFTPQAYDSSDAAAGATGMTLPTVKGTENASNLRILTVGLTQTAPVTAVNGTLWQAHLLIKPIRIAAGTANGVALKNLTAIAAATVDVTFEFFELSY
jgi:hypothetical protein